MRFSNNFKNKKMIFDRSYIDSNRDYQDNLSINSSYNMYGKRSHIFCSGNNISDCDLKIIFQKFLEKEKEKEKSGKEIENIKLRKDIENLNESKRNINYKNLLNKSIDKEINSRLNLQEKILNNFQIYNKENQRLINKILKKTSKNNKDILLMNTLDDFRIKMEKIDEDYKMEQDNYYNKINYWLSNLRNYPSKKLKKIGDKDKDNKISINNSTTFPSLYKDMKKMNNSKEDILDNYINNLKYSFGNNNNLYYDIESSISPLCP